MVHNIVKSRLGIINYTAHSLNYLAHIMRRDIGRHTDSDTRRTVYKQVRETRGKYCGLVFRVVKIGNPVNRVLFDIFKKLHRRL